MHHNLLKIITIVSPGCGNSDEVLLYVSICYISYPKKHNKNA